MERTEERGADEEGSKPRRVKSGKVLNPLHVAARLVEAGEMHPAAKETVVRIGGGKKASKKQGDKQRAIISKCC